MMYEILIVRPLNPVSVNVTPIAQVKGYPEACLRAHDLAIALSFEEFEGTIAVRRPGGRDFLYEGNAAQWQEHLDNMRKLVS